MNNPHEVLRGTLNELNTSPTVQLMDATDADDLQPEHLAISLSLGGDSLQIFNGSSHNQSSPDQSHSSTSVVNSGNRITNTYNTQLKILYGQSIEVVSEESEDKGKQLAPNNEIPRLAHSGTDSLLPGQTVVRGRNRDAGIEHHSNVGVASDAPLVDQIVDQSSNLRVSKRTSGSLHEPSQNIRQTTDRKSSTNSTQTSLITREKSSNYSKPHIKIMTRKKLETVDMDPLVRAYMSSDIDIGTHHVIPLWIPYPNMNLSAHLRPKHCSVGDVGVLRYDGSFEVMFNILMSRAENEEMKYKLIPSFQPLVLQVVRIPLVDQGTSYFSSNVSRCSEEETGACAYSFQTIAAEGKHQTAASILVLPDHANVERLSNLDIGSAVDKYVAQHSVSWYELLNGTDTGVPRRYPNGTLKMICACYKAKVWSAASTLELSQEKAASNLKAKLLKHSSSESENSIYTWEANHAFKTNRGSSNPEMNYHSEYSVAVELYTIKKRKPKSTSSGKLSLSSFTSSGIQGSMESVKSIFRKGK